MTSYSLCLSLGFPTPLLHQPSVIVTVFTQFSDHICSSPNRFHWREASVLPPWYHCSACSPPCMSSVLGRACKIASRRSTVLPVALPRGALEAYASMFCVCEASPSTRALPWMFPPFFSQAGRDSRSELLLQEVRAKIWRREGLAGALRLLLPPQCDCRSPPRSSAAIMPLPHRSCSAVLIWLWTNALTSPLVVVLVQCKKPSRQSQRGR